MRQAYSRILEKFKGKRAGIFVDEANLFYPQKALGWRIDWKKLIEFFAKWYTIKVARYYMGMPLKKEAYEKNILIKARLQKNGFEVITKPLKKIYVGKETGDFYLLALSTALLGRFVGHTIYSLKK